MDNGDSVENFRNDAKHAGARKTATDAVLERNDFNRNQDNHFNPKPQRRRFSAADKLRIVREADALPAGTVGAFLRREGIYSSQLYAWRKQRDQGQLDPGAVRQRAKAKAQADEAAQRVKELKRETRKLRRRLARAELINEIQKKFAGLLGVDLESPETNESVE